MYRCKCRYTHIIHAHTETLATEYSHRYHEKLAVKERERQIEKESKKNGAHLHWMCVSYSPHETHNKRIRKRTVEKQLVSVLSLHYIYSIYGKCVVMV